MKVFCSSDIIATTATTIAYVEDSNNNNILKSINYDTDGISYELLYQESIDVLKKWYKGSKSLALPL